MKVSPTASISTPAADYPIYNLCLSDIYYYRLRTKLFMNIGNGNIQSVATLGDAIGGLRKNTSKMQVLI